MAEVTVETFREAAKRAVSNLEAPDEKKLSKIRQLVKKVLEEQGDGAGTAEEVDALVRGIAESVQSKIETMIWPERAIEAKKRRAELDLEYDAHLMSEIRAAMAKERHG